VAAEGIAGCRYPVGRWRTCLTYIQRGVDARSDSRSGRNRWILRWRAGAFRTFRVRARERRKSFGIAATRSRTAEETFLVPVTANDDARQFDAVDLAIVAVKTYSLAEIAPAARWSAENGALISPPLNGVEITDRLIERGIPKENVLGGLTTISAERTSPGIFERHGKVQTNRRMRPQWEQTGRLQMMKRIAVWFIETSSEVLLLGVVLTLLLGHDQHEFLKDVLLYGSGIGLLFFSTGYLLTTVAVRAFWKGRSLWLYPAIATVLFVIHFEIMNMGVGGAFEPSTRLRVRVAGACIVLACTFVGSLALRQWTTVNRKQFEAQP
jgi:hypothetical protein